MLSYQEVEPIFLNLIADYGQPEELSHPNSTWQQKISALRGRVMKRLVDEVTMAFAKITMKSLQVSLKAIFCNIVRQILQLVSKLPKSGT